MLRPFRIRDLHQEPVRQNLYDAETESSVSIVQPPLSESSLSTPVVSRHGTVHLSAPEYDDIVTSHPRAALTYMDEDDGEVVTVGSSVELAERLDDVIEQSTYCLPPPSDRDNYDETTPMHLFDIRRSNSVTELWKTVEKNSTLRSITPGQNLRSISDISAIENTELPESVTVQGGSQDDIRARWFQACNAPSLPATVERGEADRREEEQAPSGDTTPRLSFGNEINVLAEVDKDNISPNVPSHLTAEGRRQAKEAGLHLHAARKLVLGNASEPTINIDQQINPWASSNNEQREAEITEAPAIDEERAETKSTAGESTSQSQSQSLLEAFEAEMAKLMEAPAASASSAQPENVPEGAEPAPAETTEEQPDASQANHHPIPVEVLVGILRNVAGGVEMLGSQMMSRVPEIERHLASAQRNVPHHVGHAFHTALAAVDTHAKNFANVLQEASMKTGHAAERVRQAELRSAEQVVESLNKVVGEFGEVGRTFFAAFENEFRRQNPATPNDISDDTQQAQETSAQYQPTAASSAPVSEPSATEPAIDDSNPPTDNREVVEDSKPTVQQPESSASEDFLGGPTNLPIDGVDAPEGQEAPLREEKGKAAVRDASSIGSASRGDTVQQPKRTLFSNWPNRPAIFLPISNTSAGPILPTIPPIQRQSDPQRNASLDVASGPAPTTRPELHKEEPPVVQTDCLFVGNLSPNATAQNVIDMFADRGFLAQVRLAIDAETKRHAGFGYAHFKSVHAAQGALDACQNSPILGVPTNLETSDNLSFEQLQQQSTSNGEDPGLATQNTESGPTARRTPRRSRYRRSWHPTSGIFSDVSDNHKPIDSVPMTQLRPNESSIRAHISSTVTDGGPSVDRPAKVRFPFPFEQHQLHSSGKAAVPNPFSDEAAVSDQETENARFSVRYPSLNDSEIKPPAGPDQGDIVSGHDHPRPRSPSHEMSRFPPLSQLDAQFLPNRTPPASTADWQRSVSAHQEQLPPEIPPKPAQLTSTHSNNVLPAQELSRQSSVHVDNPHFIPRLGPVPRRSLTTSQRRQGPIRPAPSLSRLTQPFSPAVPHDVQTSDRNLRRSATERLPRRRHVVDDYLAPRPTSYAEHEADRQIPGSYPQESQTLESVDVDVDRDVRIAMRQSEIDQCVDNLLSLGYGSSFDGGRARITVVAEAVGGRLSDAIEMIEEERKAYAEERREYSSR